MKTLVGHTPKSTSWADVPVVCKLILSSLSVTVACAISSSKHFLVHKVTVVKLVNTMSGGSEVVFSFITIASRHVGQRSFFAEGSALEPSEASFSASLGFVARFPVCWTMLQGISILCSTSAWSAYAVFGQSGASVCSVRLATQWLVPQHHLMIGCSCHYDLAANLGWDDGTFWHLKWPWQTYTTLRCVIRRFGELKSLYFCPELARLRWALTIATFGPISLFDFVSGSLLENYIALTLSRLHFCWRPAVDLIQLADSENCLMYPLPQLHPVHLSEMWLCKPISVMRHGNYSSRINTHYFLLRG